MLFFKHSSIIFNNFKTLTSILHFSSTAATSKWRENITHKHYISQITSILLQMHSHSWVPAFHNFKLSSKLTPHLVLQILRKTHNHPQISLDFFNWVKTQQGFQHDLASYCSMIHILIKSGALEAARPLVNQIVEPASTVFDEMNITISGYRDSSSSLVVSFLLENYCGRGSILEGLEFFRKMRIYGYLPLISNCNALLNLLVRVDEISLAWQVCNALIRMGIELDKTTFSILVRLLCKEGKVEKAVKLLEVMEDGSFTPNIVTYNLVIDHCCKNGAFLSAFDILDRISNKNMSLDFASYSSILDGSCKFGNLEVVDWVLRDMFAKKFLLTIGNECQNIDHEELKDGECRTMRIPFLNYDLLIQKFCKLGKSYAAEMFYEKSQRENIVLGDTSYVALLRAFSKEGRDKESLKIYNVILQRGISLNASDYNLLMNALCNKEPVDGVSKVFGDMIERGFSPGASNISKFIACQCSKGQWQDADNLLHAVLDKGFLLDDFSLCTLVEHYCTDGCLDSAISFHSKMQKLGRTLDIESYNLILSRLFLERRSEDATRIFDYMRSKNSVNVTSFTTLIRGLCRDKKLKEAMKLHDEMMKRGFKPDKVTYKSLVSGFM